jgi:lysylphosphatidylglycerol synthetase-like protein (DUF2156 family)
MTQRLPRPYVYLPELALAAACLVAIAEITGLGGRVADAVGAWLPINPASLDALDGVTAALALAALAIGVRRHKRLAWPLALATFGSAAAAQALVLRHPLAAALAVGCLLVLVIERRRFRASTQPAMRGFAYAVVGGAAGVLVVGSILADAIASAPPGTFLDNIAVQAVETLDFIDPTGVISANRPGELFEAVEFAMRASVLVALLAILAADPDRPRAAQLARRRAVVRRHARGALAPFQVGHDKLLYADSRGAGVVAYGRAGRTAVVLGDPVGPPTAGWRAFRSFVARCTAGDVDIAVYQASEAAAPVLAQLGMRVFRVGEEAVLDLTGFNLAGSRRANLRHTITRARRGGIRTAWYPDGVPGDVLVPLTKDLTSVDREWRAGRGPSLGFTISRFSVDDLRSEGVALAFDGDGRIAAFATFRRTGPRTRVLDVMRRRHGTVPGALETAIGDAAVAMASSGVTELSLGLVALAGLSVRTGSLEQRVLAAGRILTAPWYDSDGLLFFKRKFGPRWVARYGAVQRRAGILGFVVALLRLHFDLGAASPPPDVQLPGGTSVRWAGEPRS